jgi:hypothetical protein
LALALFCLADENRFRATKSSGSPKVSNLFCFIFQNYKNPYLLYHTQIKKRKAPGLKKSQSFDQARPGILDAQNISALRTELRPAFVFVPAPTALERFGMPTYAGNNPSFHCSS